MLKSKLLKIILVLFLFGLSVVLFIFYANILVSEQGKFTYNTVENIPKNRVGLLLGTSKHLSNGNDNLYYTNRIKATVALFKAGKIEYVLISGDNSRSDYDEPSDMKMI